MDGGGGIVRRGEQAAGPSGSVRPCGAVAEVTPRRRRRRHLGARLHRLRRTSTLRSSSSASRAGSGSPPAGSVPPANVNGGMRGSASVGFSPWTAPNRAPGEKPTCTSCHGPRPRRPVARNARQRSAKCQRSRRRARVPRNAHARTTPQCRSWPAPRCGGRRPRGGAETAGADRRPAERPPPRPSPWPSRGCRRSARRSSRPGRAT